MDRSRGGAGATRTYGGAAADTSAKDRMCLDCERVRTRARNAQLDPVVALPAHRDERIQLAVNGRRRRAAPATASEVRIWLSDAPNEDRQKPCRLLARMHGTRNTVPSRAEMELLTPFMNLFR
jgi:hypothetical protein